MEQVPSLYLKFWFRNLPFRFAKYRNPIHSTLTRYAGTSIPLYRLNVSLFPIAFEVVLNNQQTADYRATNGEVSAISYPACSPAFSVGESEGGSASRVAISRPSHDRHVSVGHKVYFL